MLVVMCLDNRGLAPGPGTLFQKEGKGFRITLNIPLGKRAEKDPWLL